MRKFLNNFQGSSQISPDWQTSLRRRPVYLATILVLLWVGFVLFDYFHLLLNLPWQSLNLRWHDGNLNNLILPATLFSLLNLATVVISRATRRSPGPLVVIGLTSATALLLAAAADSWLWLKVILFFGILLLAACGAVFLYRKLFHIRIPYWAGLLLSVILIQYWLFTVGLLGIFKLHAVLPFVAALVLAGGLEWKRKGKEVFGRLSVMLKGLDWPAVYFLEGLWLVLAAGFVAANTPETLSDAMRCHVPYMTNLVRDGALMPNYYWYSHLIPSPLQLTGAGGYLVLGEVGAKWIIWLLGLSAVLVIVSEVYELTGKWSVALGAAFFFISTPFMWLWLTTNYQDLPMTAFLLAGLACFRRGVGASKQWLPLAGTFWGFAIVAKITALLFIVIFLVIYFVFCRKAVVISVRQNTSLVLLTVLVLLIVILPWHILAWHWTGNPVFPLMNGVFKSPYISAALLDGFQQNYKVFFKFPNGWWDLLTWPWSLTFQTNLFVETLQGSMGPFFLIAYPVVLLCLLFGKAFENKKLALVFLVTGLLYIGACSFLLKTPYLRYWLPGLTLVFIVTVALAVSLIHKAGLYYPRWTGGTAVLFLVVLSLFIFFAWGIHVNYGPPDGLGWTLYRGKMNRDQYLQSTGNVYLYVNQNIKPGESVLAVNYQLLSSFDNFSIQIMPWYDPVMGLNKLEDYDALVKKANVRYWVVQDNAWKNYYENLGVAGKYWQKDLLVCSKNGFSVYTAKPDSNQESTVKKGRRDRRPRPTRI